MGTTNSICDDFFYTVQVLWRAEREAQPFPTAKKFSDWSVRNLSVSSI